MNVRPHSSTSKQSLESSLSKGLIPNTILLSYNSICKTTECSKLLEQILPLKPLPTRLTRPSAIIGTRQITALSLTIPLVVTLVKVSGLQRVGAKIGTPIIKWSTKCYPWINLKPESGKYVCLAKLQDNLTVLNLCLNVLDILKEIFNLQLKNVDLYVCPASFIINRVSDQLISQQ